MCFSAEASLITAGVTGVIAVASITRAKNWRDLPMAFIPGLFALQQGLEGALWLTLPVEAAQPLSSGLTLLFLLIAEVFWPAFIPVAAWLAEPRIGRRRILFGCVIGGIGLSGYLLWSIVAREHSAAIWNGHIVYVTEHQFSLPVIALYFCATSLPLVLSSRRMFAALGVLILVGSVAAYAFYWEAFVSVWCFFAAAASGVILGHFERERRLTHRMARA